jgi:hypothetical protein
LREETAWTSPRDRGPRTHIAKVEHESAAMSLEKIMKAVG